MGVTLSEKAYAGNLQFLGGTDPGYIQNIIGLAPNRSGTLYGFTNGFGNISGYLVPQLKTYIVQDETNVLQWRWLFFLTAGINLIFTTAFTLFASQKVQAFNYKTYKSTRSYFTSFDFLKFPVKADTQSTSQSSTSSSSTSSSSSPSSSLSSVSSILSTAHPV